MLHCMSILHAFTSCWKWLCLFQIANKNNLGFQFINENIITVSPHTRVKKTVLTCLKFHHLGLWEFIQCELKYLDAYIYVCIVLYTSNTCRSLYVCLHACTHVGVCVCVCVLSQLHNRKVSWIVFTYCWVKIDLVWYHLLLFEC